MNGTSSAGAGMSGSPPDSAAVDGDAPAYPAQILIWHEIVDDTTADIPVAITSYRPGTTPTTE